MTDRVVPGEIRAVRPLEKGAEFACQGGGTCSVLFLEAGIVRVAYWAGSAPERRSFAVIRPESEWAGCPFDMARPGGRYVLRGSELAVELDGKSGALSAFNLQGDLLHQDLEPPRFGSDGFRIVKSLAEDEHCYGFGQRTGQLDRRGRVHTNWTRDPVEADRDQGPGADNLYVAMPWYVSLRSSVSAAHGFFLDCTFRSSFDVGYTEPDKMTIEADGGGLVYYLIAGPEPADVLRRFAFMTGHAPLPPRWALGFHQSRWSYESQQVLDAVAEGMSLNDLPCDVIHLDIDYMRDYRVFTFDRDRFPDFRQQMVRLRDQGIRVVTIVDPGVKKEPDAGYGVYDDGLEKGVFLRHQDGTLFSAHVWPGESVFPDFSRPDVRKWWGDWHRVLIDMGVSGIWNDMNEPAITDGPILEGSRHIEPPPGLPSGDPQEPGGQPQHQEVRNLYGLGMAQATRAGLERHQPGKRPFVLTRSGFAGIQSQAAVWMGDNTSCWEHLEMMLPQLANMGMSGVPFVGVDIGGFFGNATPELYGRWFEIGSLLPFCRAHSAKGTRYAEPWSFGEEVLATVRRHLQLRYQLLPYIYTLFAEAEQTGAPVWRPLVYQYPTDNRVVALSDQILIGPDLMAAPVVRPGVVARAVYLPDSPDGWFNFWTGHHHAGGQDILQDCPPGHLPLWVRGGAVLPMGPPMLNTGEKPLDPLTLVVFGRGGSSCAIHEDDGATLGYRDGGSCTSCYFVEPEDGQDALTISASRTGKWKPVSRQARLELRGLPGIASATRDGTDLPVRQASAHSGSFVLLGDDEERWTARIEFDSIGEGPEND